MTTRKTKHEHTEPQGSEAEGLEALDRGAEPFWMQDARIAQRKIAAKMAEIRASKLDGRPTDQD